MTPERCPECGGQIREIDKDTSTGRDIRWYSCRSCNWTEEFDVGIALWKVISLGKQEEERSVQDKKARSKSKSKGHKI